MTYIYIIYLAANGTAEEGAVENVQEEEHKSETNNIQVQRVGG
jgi:hypothetical protein